MVLTNGADISRFFRIFPDNLVTAHSAIVQKLWNYCNILRDDGLSYGDYPSAEFILSGVEGLRTGSEQLTFQDGR